MQPDKISGFPRYAANPWTQINETTGKYEVQLNAVKTTITEISEAAKLISTDNDADGKVFMAQEQVSKADFLKIYTSTIAATVRMSPAAKNLFYYLLTVLKYNEDKIYIKYPEAAKMLGYKHHQPIFRGLKELISLQILARTTDHREFFINPAMVHKGNKFLIMHSYETRPDNAVEINPELPETI